MHDVAKPQLQPLDRRSGVPLHYQIQQLLMNQIQSGVLTPSLPIPPVQEIAARLGVSQMTARQAIKALCDLGVIYTRQGKGTFVSGIKHARDFRQVHSFTEEMRRQGSTASSKVLSFRLQAGSDEVRKALKLSSGQKVFRLRRIRYSNGLPMGVECSCLPLDVCPSLLDTYDPTTSLYQELAERYGIQMEVTDEVVEVGKATAEEAPLLRIEPGSPVFLLTRLSYSENGRPVEYVKSTYRGDRYKIVNRLTRAKRAPLAAPIQE
jgi:GntR family transcriptional regulator, N-acetylglucosamine utilization regulator